MFTVESPGRRAVTSDTMPRYNIKEKFWGWGDDFHILNEQGQPVFFVDGKAFSWGSKLSFQSMDGRELAFISQKLITLRPKFEIYRDGALFAEIVKEFSWFRKEFTMDVPGPNDYWIKGSFWDYRYEFLRQDRVVARVSRAVWSWTHCYGVEIEDGEDDVSILCAAIVIDQVLHDEKRTRSFFRNALTLSFDHAKTCHDLSR